jgi:hypothetical protein
MSLSSRGNDCCELGLRQGPPQFIPAGFPLTATFNRGRKTQPSPSPHRIWPVPDASSILNQILFQKVHKPRNNKSINQIDKQAAYKRHNKERIRGLTVFCLHRLHICHCRRNCTKPETAVADCNHSSIIRLSHEFKCNKHRADKHQQGLGQKEQKHGDCQIRKLPQLQCHHGKSQED